MPHGSSVGVNDIMYMRITDGGAGGSAKRRYIQYNVTTRTYGGDRDNNGGGDNGGEGGGADEGGYPRGPGRRARQRVGLNAPRLQMEALHITRRRRRQRRSRPSYHYPPRDEERRAERNNGSSSRDLMLTRSTQDISMTTRRMPRLRRGDHMATDGRTDGRGRAVGTLEIPEL